MVRKLGRKKRRTLKQRIRSAFRPAKPFIERLIKGRKRSPRRSRLGWFERKRRQMVQRRRVLGVRGKAAVRSKVLRRKGYRR